MDSSASLEMAPTAPSPRNAASATSAPRAPVEDHEPSARALPDAPSACCCLVSPRCCSCRCRLYPSRSRRRRPARLDTAQLMLMPVSEGCMWYGQFRPRSWRGRGTIGGAGRSADEASSRPPPRRGKIPLGQTWARWRRRSKKCRRRARVHFGSIRMNTVDPPRPRGC